MHSAATRSVRYVLNYFKFTSNALLRVLAFVRDFRCWKRRTVAGVQCGLGSVAHERGDTALIPEVLRVL